MNRIIDRPALIAAVAALASAPLALAACETVAEAVGDSYQTSMTGAQEVPGPGDPDGSGTAEVTVDAATPQVCYDLKVAGIDTATMAHIHRGAMGVAGPPVVTLEPPADGAHDGCVGVARELAAEIIANPAGFYVNVHNAAFPAGAIRGQLRR